MVFGGSEELSRLLEQSRQLQQRSELLQERLATMVGEGVAADGLVRITVTPGGVMSELRLDPRVMRMDSQSLAEAIQQAHGAASADLQTRIGEATAEVFGAEFANLLNGSASAEDLIGPMRASTEQTLDQSLAEIERLRRSLER
jgi:DNA-binding protein YbaB